MKWASLLMSNSEFQTPISGSLADHLITDSDNLQGESFDMKNGYCSVITMGNFIEI
jgi:hypothetical protein